MTGPAFRTLVGVELRRSRQFLVRLGIIFSVAAVALLVLRFGPSEWTAVLSILGIAIAFQVPAEVLKDKVSGDLELLTTLPVSASTLAAARVTAATLFSGLSALAVAAATTLAWLGTATDASAVSVFAVSFPLFWVVISAGSSATLGLTLRFKTKTVVIRGFVVVLAAYLSSAYLVDRFFGNPLRLIQATVNSDHTLAIVIGSALVGSAVVLTASFLLTRKGFEIYQPEPDAMDW